MRYELTGEWIQGVTVVVVVEADSESEAIEAADNGAWVCWRQTPCLCGNTVENRYGTCDECQDAAYNGGSLGRW